MKKVFALSIAVLLCNVVHAQTTKQYFFADKAIGIYADMRETLNQPAASESLVGADILKFHLNNAVRQGNVYRMEALKIKEYKKSKDEGIRHAAIFLEMGILLVQVANSNLINYIESLLNNPKQLLQEGTVSRKMAELTDATEKAWQTYAQGASAGVSSALTDMPRNLKDLKKSSDEPATKLLITKSEIDLLESHLTSAFGPVLADQNQAKWADVPAISMWKFLHDKWTPATER